MNNKESFAPQLEQESNIHLSAEQVRNPYQDQLREIAEEYSEKLRVLLPPGSVVELGGSLRSNTALKGHNDIDIRLLLPEDYAAEEKITAVSKAIKDVVPFQKVRPVVDVPGEEKFAVMHELSFEKEGIEGDIEVEVSVRPAEGYVGFAKFQETFPAELLDEFVLYKDQTRRDKVKGQFYALTRWLYAQEYWDKKGEVVGALEMLEEAKKMFWGDGLEIITAKPQPEV